MSIIEDETADSFTRAIGRRLGRQTTVVVIKLGDKITLDRSTIAPAKGVQGRVCSMVSAAVMDAASSRCSWVWADKVAHDWACEPMPILPLMPATRDAALAPKELASAAPSTCSSRRIGSWIVRQMILSNDEGGSTRVSASKKTPADAARRFSQAIFPRACGAFR